MALFSQSLLINSLTAIILGIWLIFLLASTLPLDIATDLGKRDLIEALLEICKKVPAFAAVTSKTYLWRFAAAFAVIKKGLEVHVDPAPERVAGINLAFIGALVAKAFEHDWSNTCL